MNDQINEITNDGEKGKESGNTATIYNKYIKGNSEIYLEPDSSKEVFRVTGSTIKLDKQATTKQAEEAVKVAQGKGWSSVKVSGTDSFKKAVWMEANKQGMEVSGYRATEQDKRQLDAITKDKPVQRSAEQHAKVAPTMSGSIGDSRSSNPEAETQRRIGAAKLERTQPEPVGMSAAAIANRKIQDARDRAAQTSDKPAQSVDDKIKEIGKDWESRHQDTAQPSTYIRNLAALTKAYSVGETDKIPELKRLATLETEATTFAISSMKRKAEQDQFVSRVVDRGLDALAKGAKLPEPKKAREQSIER